MITLKYNKLAKNILIAFTLTFASQSAYSASLPIREYNQESQESLAFNDILNGFGDILVKVPAKNQLKPPRSVIIFYDPTCNYCNEMLQEVNALNQNSIDVYIAPFVNNINNIEALKVVYLAWSTKHPISSIFNKTMPTELDKNSVALINKLFVFSKTYLKINETPFVLFDNDKFVSGYASATDIINNINK